MKNRAFVLGVLILIVTLIVDVEIFMGGSYALGFLVCIGTVLVFASGIIWLVSHDDQRLHFRRGWLIVPLSIFGYGIFKTIVAAGIYYLPSPENLSEIGNLIMTRFQIGLWLVSLVLLLAFVAAGSLMTRRRA